MTFKYTSKMERHTKQTDVLMRVKNILTTLTLQTMHDLQFNLTVLELDLEKVLYTVTFQYP